MFRILTVALVFYAADASRRPSSKIVDAPHWQALDTNMKMTWTPIKAGDSTVTITLQYTGPAAWYDRYLSRR